MNRKVVVTASTKGIGYEIIKKFLKDNDDVILNYAHDDSVLSSIYEELKEFKGRYFIIKKDLSSPQNIEEFVNEVTSIFSKIDVLVLNAGITNRKSLEDITYEEYKKVMDINLNMPFYLVKKINNSINNNGNIIFMSSVIGIYPHAISIPYSVSKAGLKMLAESLVKVFKIRKIRVNTIAPGFVDTPWQKNKTLEHRKRIEKKIALERFALPEEIADLCFYICENNYINGATLRIDGGYDME